VAATEELVRRCLAVGDGDDKIVAFLKANGMPYNFDPAGLSYQAYVPESRHRDAMGVESVISVDIFVDMKHLFKRAEVRMVYTFL
jgi:hypothetical protein